MPRGNRLATARGLAKQFRRCYGLRLSFCVRPCSFSFRLRQGRYFALRRAGTTIYGTKVPEPGPFVKHYFGMLGLSIRLAFACAEAQTPLRSLT